MLPIAMYAPERWENKGMNINKQVSLNLNVRGLGQSATIAINDRSKKLQQTGRTIYRMGLGQSPFPVPTPVVESLKLHAREKDYLPSKGHPELCRAVAEYHRIHDGFDAHGDRVMIGPGSKELMFLLQLTYYGELIVPTPCWVSYTPQAKILGRTIRLYPTLYEDKWRFKAEQLEEVCKSEHDDYRPRVLILNYPGNPEGCTYNSTELKDIAAVARKYQVILLSDEIYGPLHHEGAHISVSRYYPEGTIVSSGLSKWCGAGGWRLGTFAFPEELSWLCESMASVASETFTSVCTPVQCAAITAFQGGSKIERYLWRARRILKVLGNDVADKLNAAGVRAHQPEGGFYLFLDFSQHRERLAERGIRTSAQLTEALLNETGVAILPGSSFERPDNELNARMAYVDFDGAKALAATETMPLDEPLPDNFTNVWCHNVVKATDLMCEWIGT